MTVLKLLSEPLTISHQKSVKRNLTIKSQTFGVLAAFCTNWLLSDMLLTPIVITIPPFLEPNLTICLGMKGLVLKILRGSYPALPPNYSLELKELISEMLTRDPAKRPSIKKILEKEFLAV